MGGLEEKFEKAAFIWSDLGKGGYQRTRLSAAIYKNGVKIALRGLEGR